MILIVLAALCVLSVPLTGGSLGRLAKLELRFLWAAPLALGLQVIIITIAPGGSESFHAAVHVATYALVGLFLWANRRLPGAALIASGAVMNVLAIVTNQGVMPQSRTAQRLAGLAPSHGFQNSAALAHPHLLWLGDIIPVPVPFGLHNVLSVGDCLIFVGMIVLLRRTCDTAATDPDFDAPPAKTDDHAPLGTENVLENPALAAYLHLDARSAKP